MSVILEDDSGDCWVYCKGAPKLIEKRAIQEFLPPDHQEKVNNVCKDGLRLISLSFKKIHKSDLEKMSRKDIEQNLVFLGFYVMENSLKPETKTSLAIITTPGIVIYIFFSPKWTNITIATITNNLSAIGSKHLPKLL